MGLFIFNKSVPANTAASSPVKVGPTLLDGKYIRKVHAAFDAGITGMSVGFRIIEDSQVFPAKGSEDQWMRGVAGTEVTIDTNIALGEEPYNVTVQFYNTDGAAARLVEVRIEAEDDTIMSLLLQLRGITGKLLKIWTDLAKPAGEQKLAKVQ